MKQTALIPDPFLSGTISIVRPSASLKLFPPVLPLLSYSLRSLPMNLHSMDYEEGNDRSIHSTESMSPRGTLIPNTESVRAGCLPASCEKILNQRLGKKNAANFRSGLRREDDAE